MRRAYLQMSLILLVALSLCACKSREHEDLHLYIEKLRKTEEYEHQKYTPIHEINLPTSISYTARAYRAPFASSETKTGGKIETKNPLQNYPISMLRFVGTLMWSNQIYAYILAPDGVIYKVKEGDMIGDHYGKVMKIQVDQLNIKEEKEEHGKSSMQSLITMHLRST